MKYQYQEILPFIVIIISDTKTRNISAFPAGKERVPALCLRKEHCPSVLACVSKDEVRRAYTV
jgi:hypothetical protein